MKEIEYNAAKIEYTIFDPTGNITALVETAVDVADQPAVASGIMDKHPEVEQVGFVTYSEDGSECGRAEGSQPLSRNGTKDPSVEDAEWADINLRMAGGEFCGNATMCAAALYLLRRGSAGACSPAKSENEETCSNNDLGSAADRTQLVMVSVSGAAAPVTVHLRAGKASRVSQAKFEAAVEMPPALSIDEIKFNMEKSPRNGRGAVDSGAFFLSLLNMDKLPLVRMEGIDHIIAERGSAFYNLKDNKSLAESFIKKWCGILGSDCLGIMFLGENDISGKRNSVGRISASDADMNTNSAGSAGEVQLRKLIPLVYVPGADTVFWENSCASGSAAAGIYLAAQAGSSVDVIFEEPAGRLRVESDPLAQTTILHGTVQV